MDPLRPRRALAGLVLTASGLAQAPAPLPLQRAAPPYTVYCHAGDPALADAAAATVAATWKVAVELLRPNAAGRATPLTIHVYPDRATYVAGLQRIEKRPPEEAQGFASPYDRTAHLYLVLRPRWHGTGLDPMNRKVIIHEAFHLATFACMANRGLFQPRWFTEGIAEWAEIEVLQTGGWSKGRERDYHEWHTLNLARNMLAADRLPKVDDILHDRFGALQVNDVYAAINRFFVLLVRRHGPAMRAFIDRVRQLPVRPGAERVFLAALQEELGADAFGGLDAELAELVRGARVLPLPARWYAPRDGVRGGDVEYQPGEPRLHWLDRAERRSYTLKGRVTLHGEGFPQGDLVFGRHGERGPLRLSFVPGGGVFLMTKVEGAQDESEWALLAANRDALTLVSGASLDIRVTVRADRITASIKGRTVLRAAVEGFDPRGRWGVGGPPGSRSSWKNLGLR